MPDEAPLQRPEPPEQPEQSGCWRRFFSTGGGGVLGGALAGSVGALIGGIFGAIIGIIVAVPPLLNFLGEIMGDSDQGSGMFLLIILFFAVIFLGGGALTGGIIGALAAGGIGTLVGGGFGALIGNLLARVPWLGNAAAVIGALALGGIALFCLTGILFNQPPALDPPTVSRPPTLAPMPAPPLTPESDGTVTYAPPGGSFALDMPADWRVFPLHDPDLPGIVLRSPDATSEIIVLPDPTLSAMDDSRGARRDYAHTVVQDYFAPYGIDNISRASFTDSNREGWLREYYPCTYVGPDGNTWRGRIYIYHEGGQRSVLLIGSANPRSYQNETVIETELDILRSYRQPA